MDSILEPLTNSFNQCKLNVSLRKKAYTLFELMNELVATEYILKAKASIHMAHTSSSKPKGGKKKKGSKHEGKPIATRANKAKNKAAKAKPKGTCFHSDEARHWKRNCQKYVTFKCKSINSLFFVETCW